MTFRVDSEVGQLRQAIVHRPGLELSRLTPENIGEMLFDDVMWASKAKEEHDAFAEALRDKGVHVLYYAELLAETLELKEGRAFVLDRAWDLEVRGTVANRPDGSVECVVEGPRDQVERLIQSLREGPSSARVDAVDVVEQAARGDLPPMGVSA